MTAAEIMTSGMPVMQILEFSLRVVVACLCGVLIGKERAARYKEAGIRTHVLVACTACVLMIISKYGFSDMIGGDGSFYAGSRAADSARIAAQIVSGVGFLGAGVIFKTGNSIKGLTTAAGIWATAAIGMCLGGGLYWLGIFTTVVILLLQFFMHRHPYGVDGYTTNMITVCIMEPDGRNTIIKKLIESVDAKITETGIRKNDDGSTTYSLTVMTKKFITFEDCEKYMEEHPEIVSLDSFPVQ